MLVKPVRLELPNPMVSFDRNHGKSNSNPDVMKRQPMGLDGHDQLVDRISQAIKTPDSNLGDEIWTRTP